MTHIKNLSWQGHETMYLQQVQLHLAALAVELDLSLPSRELVTGKPGSTGRDAQEIEYISESLALIVAAVAAL
jgi:hypothetical protein